MIKAIENLPNDNVCRRLGDQLLRSSTSVIANFVEGQSGRTTKDFTHFLQISLKSANESKLWISLLKDTGKLKEETAKLLINEMDEISKIIAQSIITLKNKN